MYKQSIKSAIMALALIATCPLKTVAQQVQVEGELKVTNMSADDNEQNLVTRRSDGTLGTRSVASLPLSPPPIDTTRNLASDYTLAKHLCDCPNLPPFMIKKLLESGYTEGDLAGAGVPEQNIIDAIRFGSFRDPRDDQFYKTVKIGTQTWMAENLNIGTMITATDQADNGRIEKYCYNDLPSNCNSYGGLYQWNEMMQYTTVAGTQGICPTGWHIPTDDEWKTLEMELGMTQAQADAMGYRGSDQASQLGGNESLWTDGPLDQNGAFDSRGFMVLPAGWLAPPSGLFIGQSDETFFWSSSESGSVAYYRGFFYSDPRISRDIFGKSGGFSIRCVQD